MTRLWAAVAMSYLVGSVPTAYLVIRALKGVDIRTVGSGNVGATNVSRAAGRPAGIAVFILDAAKGWLSARVLAPWLGASADGLSALICGSSAVIGHIAPVWLGFRGGKGVATTIGALIGYDPTLAALCGGVWGLGFALTRYVSVSSIAAIAAVPVIQGVFGKPAQELAVGGALACLVIWKHRANLARLRQGTEPRAGRRRSPAPLDAESG